MDTGFAWPGLVKSLSKLYSGLGDTWLNQYAQNQQAEEKLQATELRAPLELLQTDANEKTGRFHFSGAAF